MRCQFLTEGPGSSQVWKASLTAGQIDRDAGGSSLGPWLECAGRRSPVYQDDGGQWSAGVQTGGSGSPKRDAAEGQVRRWQMNHRQGHWNRLRERAIL